MKHPARILNARVKAIGTKTLELTRMVSQSPLKYFDLIFASGTRPSGLRARDPRVMGTAKSYHLHGVSFEGVGDTPIQVRVPNARRSSMDYWFVGYEHDEEKSQAVWYRKDNGKLVPGQLSVPEFSAAVTDAILQEDSARGRTRATGPRTSAPTVGTRASAPPGRSPSTNLIQTAKQHGHGPCPLLWPSVRRCVSSAVPPWTNQQAENRTE